MGVKFIFGPEIESAFKVVAHLERVHLRGLSVLVLRRYDKFIIQYNIIVSEDFFIYLFFLSDGIYILNIVPGSFNITPNLYTQVF